jgi:hypothetical protein
VRLTNKGAAAASNHPQAQAFVLVLFFICANLQCNL